MNLDPYLILYTTANQNGPQTKNVKDEMIKLLEENLHDLG